MRKDSCRYFGAAHVFPKSKLRNKPLNYCTRLAQLADILSVEEFGLEINSVLSRARRCSFSRRFRYGNQSSTAHDRYTLNYHIVR